MSKKPKLSSANLYDELDKKEAEDIKKEIRDKKIGVFKDKVLFRSYEFLKVFIFIGIIVGAFFLRYHYSTEISQGFDKFTDTITGVVDKSSSNAIMKKNLEADKKVKEQDAKIAQENKKAKEPLATIVPDITVTGEVDKENGKYMIFKYDNKIFTLKEGDKFDNNMFVIKKIEGNILEIEDVDGNIFSYSK